jgi:hypothetical protein
MEKLIETIEALFGQVSGEVLEFAAGFPCP